MRPLDISDYYLPESEGGHLSAYAVDGEARIRRLLEQVIASDEIVTLFPGDDTEAFVLTRIMALGTKGLLVDVKTDEGRLLALRPGAECIAVCVMNHLKVQFHMLMERLDDGADGHVLQCALPSRVYRIQRREAFRVQPPATRSVKVVLRDGQQGEVAFAVKDMSAIGLRFLAPAASHWVLGSSHEHARVEIEERAPLPCTLTIVSIEQQSATNQGAPGLQIACELGHLTGEVARQLQQFVMELERAERGLPPF